jgi:hypothetical protein
MASDGPPLLQSRLEKKVDALEGGEDPKQLLAQIA